MGADTMPGLMRCLVLVASDQCFKASLNNVWQLTWLGAEWEQETKQERIDNEEEHEKLYGRHRTLQAQHATAQAQLAVVTAERDSLGALLKSYEHGHDAGELQEAHVRCSVRCKRVGPPG